MSLLHVISPRCRTVCYQQRPLGIRNIKGRGVSETNLKVCSVLVVKCFARNVRFICYFVRRKGCQVQSIKWEERQLQTTFLLLWPGDQQQLSLQDLFLGQRPLVLKAFQSSSGHLMFQECPVSCWIRSRWYWTSQCCSYRAWDSTRQGELLDAPLELFWQFFTAWAVPGVWKVQEKASAQ